MKKRLIIISSLLMLCLLAGWSVPEECLYVKDANTTIYFPIEAKGKVYLNEENQPINISNQQFIVMYENNNIIRVAYSDPYYQPYIIVGENQSFITLSGDIESNFINKKSLDDYSGTFLAILVTLTAIQFVFGVRKD